MKGKQHIIVSNRDAKFKFDLNRNITIVRGNSGTGKTTLLNYYDMTFHYYCFAIILSITFCLYFILNYVIN